MTDTDAGAPLAGRARTVALVLILLAALMDLMDVTILNVVLPTIETGLHAGPAAVEWMLAGYTLAQTLGLITGARLGDRLGHKRVFLAGLAGFTVASALCGAATDPGMLVAARILQGCAPRRRSRRCSRRSSCCTRRRSAARRWRRSRR